MTRKKDEPEEPPRDETEREKQERVIHTRVSERLEQELKDRAASLGVSVSNLVRNVLDNAFDLVEDIVADSARIASSASTGWRAVTGAGKAVRPGTVLGWQELVLNLNAVCSKCNAIIARGTDAAIAIVQGSGERPIVCLICLQEIRHEPEPEPSHDHRRKR